MRENTGTVAYTFAVIADQTDLLLKFKGFGFPYTFNFFLPFFKTFFEKLWKIRMKEKFPKEDERNIGVLATVHRDRIHKGLTEGLEISESFNLIKDDDWFVDWKNRENNKTDYERYLDTNLYFACKETQRWGLQDRMEINKLAKFQVFSKISIFDKNFDF